MKNNLIAVLMTATAFIVNNAQAEVKVSTNGGLKVSSGDYSVQVGGRLMYDYNRAEKNGIVDEDQFDDRRARLYVKGNVSKDWAYKLQFNLDGTGFEDLYLQYLGWGKAAKVTIGNQREPFGLQDQTSSNDISVLERSALMELFAPGRQEGVQVHGHLNDNLYYGVGAFFQDVDQLDAGEEIGFAGRMAWTPIKSDATLIHLGAAYFDNSVDDGLGLEAAAVTGPFHIQAEYADGTIGNTDVSGYYVQAGYILTGETRPYKDGKFKRVTPKGKAGAWELVARYEDGDGSFDDIELGDTDATSYTIGVNYYANKNIRIGVNYTEGEDNLSDDEGSEFRVRFGLAF